jgi:hypothetical protein
MDKGYGVIHVDGRKRYAHRYSHELHKGPLGRLHALHSCDNPRCVNPEHLRAGTHQENMQDAKERRRFNTQKGRRHPTAKLTPDQVREIRASQELGTTLAERFGVGRTTIYAVRRNQNWRDL